MSKGVPWHDRREFWVALACVFPLYSVLRTSELGGKYRAIGRSSQLFPSLDVMNLP